MERLSVDFIKCTATKMQYNACHKAKYSNILYFLSAVQIILTAT